jgi:hypothetical protein
VQTRSSDNWQSTPGSFDPLHTDHFFPTDGNPYGIPTIPHAPLSAIPARLLPYRYRVRTESGTIGSAVHFFLDDYRFETTWSRPQKALQYLRDFKTVLTPDFSLYPGWPMATQIWNVYRSRWCGAYWSSLGLQVIPTVSWAGRESFGFSFTGIARHSLVAVATVGLKRADWPAFSAGFLEMVERITPSCVLCYGHLPAFLADMVDVRFYPTHWEVVKQADDGR